MRTTVYIKIYKTENTDTSAYTTYMQTFVEELVKMTQY